ncbi:TolC family protein [soil metagenome]
MIRCPNNHYLALLLAALIACGLFLDSAHGQSPTGSVSLRQAIGYALAQNPELSVFPKDLRIAEARRLQASLVPNPEISLFAEDFGGSGRFRGANAIQNTLQLSQVVELGGKRRARIRAAEAGRGVVNFDFEVKRLKVAAETAQAFVDLLGAQERLALSRQGLDLAERFVPDAEKRVEAGRSSPVETTRARVAVAASQITVEKEEGQVALARARLAAQWGSTQPQFSRAVGNLRNTPAVASLSVLRSRVAAHPALARGEAERTQREAHVAVERRKAIPDITLSGGGRQLNETDDTAFVAGLSIPLPLWNRNQGSIKEAQLLASRSVDEIRSVEVSLNTQLAIAYESLEDAKIEFTLLQSSVLPELQKAYELTNEGYLSGRFSYLELSETRRALAESRLQYLQALINYHKAAAAIDGLTGASSKTTSDFSK